MIKYKFHYVNHAISYLMMEYLLLLLSLLSGMETKKCVRWQNTLSNNFTIGNGIRQGGVLSPVLFARYINDLLVITWQLYFRNRMYSVGDIYYNILAYADDLVLLAPKLWAALQ